jgi:hypothetical protein
MQTGPGVAELREAASPQNQGVVRIFSDDHRRSIPGGILTTAGNKELGVGIGHSYLGRIGYRRTA